MHIRDLITLIAGKFRTTYEYCMNSDRIITHYAPINMNADPIPQANRAIFTKSIACIAQIVFYFPGPGGLKYKIQIDRAVYGF